MDGKIFLNFMLYVFPPYFSFSRFAFMFSWFTFLFLALPFPPFSMLSLFFLNFLALFYFFFPTLYFPSFHYFFLHFYFGLLYLVYFPILHSNCIPSLTVLFTFMVCSIFYSLFLPSHFFFLLSTFLH